MKKKDIFECESVEEVKALFVEKNKEDENFSIKNTKFDLSFTGKELTKNKELYDKLEQS